MREVVETLARSLVEKPECIQLKEHKYGNEVSYELSVAPEDMGRIIGRQGKIAKAMRTVLKAAATKKKLYVNLEIVDPEPSEEDDVEDTSPS